MNVALLAGLGTTMERLRVPESFDIQPGGGKPDRIFDPLLESERIERTVTPRHIERAGGMTAVEVVELIGAFGLSAPAPDDPWFTPAEADVVIALSQMREVWPRDVYLQAARVRAAFEQLLPLADPMIVAVHRRWIEHALAQAAVGEAELRSPDSLLPGAQQVSFLFCDLKDFTAYADTNGDAAAIEAIGKFSGIVHEEQGGGRVVKGIGDAYMLVYARPEDAVAAGARMVRRMHAAGPPFVHASAHHRGAITVRGMSTPVDVYTLIDAGA